MHKISLISRAIPMLRQGMFGRISLHPKVVCTPVRHASNKPDGNNNDDDDATKKKEVPLPKETPSSTSSTSSTSKIINDNTGYAGIHLEVEESGEDGKASEDGTSGGSTGTATKKKRVRKRKRKSSVITPVDSTRVDEIADQLAKNMYVRKSDVSNGSGSEGSEGSISERYEQSIRDSEAAAAAEEQQQQQVQGKKTRGTRSSKKRANTNNTNINGTGNGEGKNEFNPNTELPRLPNGLVPHAATAPKLPYITAVPSPARPLFPGLYYPCIIKDPVLIAHITKNVKNGNPYVGVFMAKNQQPDTFIRSKTTIQPIDKQNPSINAEEYDPVQASKMELYNVGCLAQIYKMNRVEGGGVMLVLVGLRRIERTGTKQLDPFLVYDVKHIDEPTRNMPLVNENGMLKAGKHREKDKELISALTLEIINTLKSIVKGSHVFSEQLTFLLNNIDWSHPATLADVCATTTTIDVAGMQKVLETYNLIDRLKLALQLLQKEKGVIHLQQDIQKKVESDWKDTQRKFFLQEQLKAIKKELGMEKDDKAEAQDKYKKLLEGKTLPEEVQKVWDAEMTKLGHLEPTSLEFNITRNYLDWLGNLPWNIQKKEVYDLDSCEQILNDDHYGLGDVKEKIIQFVAVSKLRGNAQGKILLLSGPPGVGKTSIGKSIANALGREFFRFSVGGLTDATEIKGHRRAYVGAMPGKLVQALKKTQVNNPVILIDEIDKMGRGMHGDPASALLEALDPEQNNGFLDHYLDVPVDLSKVLFVCTANNAEAIPAPLLDRMVHIRIGGYVEQEKTHIARHYLTSNVAEKSGVGKKNAYITTTALTHLIKWYCRESGVRSLNKYIEQIYDKLAVEIVRGKKPLPLVVDTSNLSKYVGQEVFTQERMYTRCPVGVVMGLAWSSIGGSILYLESIASSVRSLSKSQGKLQLTMTKDITSTNTTDVTTDKDKDTSTTVPVTEQEKPNSDNDKNTDDTTPQSDPPGHGDGNLRVTGQLGDVMKESTSIAYTVAKVVLARLYAEEQALLKKPITAITSTVSTQVKDVNEEVVTVDAPIPQVIGGTSSNDVTTVQPVEDSGGVIPPLWLKQLVLKPTTTQSSLWTKKSSKKSGTSTSTGTGTGTGTTKVEDAIADALNPTGIATPQPTEDVATTTTTTTSTTTTSTGKDVPSIPSASLPAPESDYLRAASTIAYQHHVPAVNQVYASTSLAEVPPSVLHVPDVNYFRTTDIHLHIPQGAIPKDGPSAGIAICSSLLSTALNRPLVKDIAMTGELCLTGRVLAIGGLKEKLIAAKRASVSTIIVPKANTKDIADMPAFITSGMTIYLVDTIEEVVRLVFGSPWSLGGQYTSTCVQRYPQISEEAMEDMIDAEEEEKAFLQSLSEQQQEPESPVGVTEESVETMETKIESIPADVNDRNSADANADTNTKTSSDVSEPESSTTESEATTTEPETTETESSTTESEASTTETESSTTESDISDQDSVGTATKSDN